MIRYTLLFLFISFSSGQLIDELEILYNDDRFLFSPDSLVNKNGFWYSGDGDAPYTGRLKILSRDRISKKVAECTIVNGVKNGNFMQYYDQKDRIPGIMGLYIDDKKEGTWTWIESSSERRNRSWETTDMQTITSIEYRDGIKHGSVVVYRTDLRSYDFVQNYSFPLDLKILQGNYMNELKTGDWFYYDNIFSDFDLNTEPKRMIEASVHWSRKESYSDNIIFDSEIKNIGGRRADFVKVDFVFRKNWSGETRTLTTFIKGSYNTFDTGIVSDASLLPGANGKFDLYVPQDFGTFIGYSYVIDWEEYQ